MGRWIRRTWRRLTGRYEAMACKSCGYQIPYRGDRRRQAEHAFDHWEAIHENEES